MQYREAWNDMSPQRNQELSRNLLQIIIIRALVFLVALNLADRLNLLPDRIGTFPFLTFFNILAAGLTVVSLVWWRLASRRRQQLLMQVAVDLALTTALVGYTRGIDSSFVSFYLLIIIYCSLTLGRNGGRAVAALSTILYAGIIIANHLNAIGAPAKADPRLVTFRIAAHVLGFWAVALLGAYLHRRLRLVESELREKIDSLTELRRLHEHIIASIRSGLITTDLRGRIALFNVSAGELTGRDPAAMIGHSVGDLLGDDFWKEIRDSNLLRNARALRHEQWLALPGGARRYLGFSVSPLRDAEHQFLGYIMSFQDLTEISRLEHEVRLKDRMAAVGSMAAGIAHEIRNPLTAIRGSVEILRSRSSLPSKDERLLDILIQESDRLNKFIEGFLDFARPKKHEKEALDLAPILRDAVTLLSNSPQMQEKHSVHLDIESEGLPIVGSPDQLKQVFWNLAQNAIRAMPSGGEMRISLRRAPGQVQVVFEDGGVGMSGEELKQVFQPFQSGFKGGVGLGLSIVFQIMEDHQGSISFDSEKGRGTRVTLSFPVANTAMASAPERRIAGE